MDIKRKRTRRALVAVVAAVAVLGAAGVALAASQKSKGPDYVYGSPNPLAGARATVKVENKGKGGSHVKLHVWGVEAAAGRTFGAHVHQLSCGELASASGGHYQHAGATGTLEQREVWLDVTINRKGNGHSTAKRPWAIDQTTMRSVVIHELPTASDTGIAGPRLACINLDGDG